MSFVRTRVLSHASTPAQRPSPALVSTFPFAFACLVFACLLICPSAASTAAAAAAAAASVAAGQSQATSPTGAPAEVEPFAKALDACEAGTLQAPHPLMASFTVTHTVTGLTDGRCAYEQTMPGKMTMVCKLTEGGRKALAEELRRTAKEGRMSGSSKAAPPAWMTECEIVTPSGQRMPAAGKPRAN